MPEDTIFHKILKGDIPSDKVFENEHVYAFNDINPVAPTHILLIHKTHFIENISDMTKDSIEAVGQLMYAAKLIAEEQSITDYRLVTNNGEGIGQTVFYLHFHLLAGREMGWPPG